MPKKYSSVESAHCLKVQNLVDLVRKEIFVKHPDASKEQHLTLSGEMLEKFEVDKQKFEFINIPNNLGGVRWYVRCPACGKKSLKLYKPDSTSSSALAYKCKECHHLKSPSALMGPTKMYKEVLRPLKKLNQLRKLLNSSKTLPDSKITEYMDQYESIKAELEKSPYFRLYKFKQEGKGIS